MISDSLTIFIPLKHYDRRYLADAVASVFAQSRPTWRLLVVADSDPSWKLPDVLEEPLRDERARLVVREGARLAGAYNTAMRAAETEFVAPLLGDDLLAPHAVATMIDSISRNPGIDFFHSGRYFVNEEGARISSDYPARHSVVLDDFVTGTPVKHMMCWRAQVGLACGGVDESLINFASDDYDFPWTMMEHGARFQSVPEALYIVRDHRAGYRLTTHVTRSEQAAQLRQILKKHGVGPVQVRRRVREARRGYLRQSLFRNRLHRWVSERLGFDAHRGWHEPYKQ